MAEFRKVLEVLLIVGLIGSIGSTIFVYNLESAKYSVLVDDFNELSSEYDSLQEEYDSLSGSYEVLLKNYSILLGKYILLQGNYTELQDIYLKLLAKYDDLKNNYTELQKNYTEVEMSYKELNASYNQLLSAYEELSTVYDELYNCYVILNSTYWMYVNTLRNMPLPLKLCVFYEAVRRGEESRLYPWQDYANFERDMILHDTWQFNAFINYTYMFVDIFVLEYGNESSMAEAWYSMYWSFYPWLPYWGLSGYSEAELHQWVIDNIDYEYDDDINWGIERFGDYPKFPVETALRTLGDCEDQAILDAALLESCGYETVIGIVHDDNHPTLGEFYHGFLWVKVGDTYDEAREKYPGAVLWLISETGYDDYVWLLLDPTWDVPCGDTPSWLQDYIDAGFQDWDSIFSYAVVKPPTASSSQPQLAQLFP